MSIQEQTEVEQTKAPTVSVPVNLVRLSKVGQRPDFLDYLVQLWDRRSFIFFDARARVQSGHDKTHLGTAWLVLTPVLNGLSFYLIFGVFLGTSKGIENFIGYLIIGVFTFQMSTRSILGGAKSLTSNTSMIRAFQFPRASLPIAVNVRELLSNIPVTIVMLLFVIFTAPAEEITWRWLLIVPAILLQFLFNLGIGMLLAPVMLKVPDLSHLLSFRHSVLDVRLGGVLCREPLRQVPGHAHHHGFQPDIPGHQNHPRFGALRHHTWPGGHGLSWLCGRLGSVAAGLFVFWRGEESYGRV